jgi:hypothetical protein
MIELVHGDTAAALLCLQYAAAYGAVLTLCLVLRAMCWVRSASSHIKFWFHLSLQIRTSILVRLLATSKDGAHPLRHS